MRALPHKLLVAWQRLPRRRFHVFGAYKLLPVTVGPERQSSAQLPVH